VRSLYAEVYYASHPPSWGGPLRVRVFNVDVNSERTYFNNKEDWSASCGDVPAWEDVQYDLFAFPAPHDSDSWSRIHLGYLYPGTTSVMIKLGHK